MQRRESIRTASLTLLRAIRYFWRVLGISLVMLLAMELGFKAVFALRDGPVPDATETHHFWPEFRRACSPLRDQPWVDTYAREWDESYSTRWEPYVYWRRNPYHGETVNIDQRGVRATQNPVSWEAADLKVLAFGGSTLWGTGARDEGTIASDLSRLLNDAGLGSVCVENWGESGYSSTQEVILLYLLLRRGVRPNLVVFYDGFNDLHAARQNGEAGIPMNESRRRADFDLGRQSDQPELHEKALLRDLFTRSSLVRAMGAVRNRIIAPPEAETIPPVAVDTDALMTDVVHDYLSNVEQVRALAEKFGFEALFFWQPMLASKDPLSEEERSAAEAWGEPNLEFERKVNEKLAVAVANVPDISDLQDLFDEDPQTVFLDYVHIGESGNRRVAQVMVDTFHRRSGHATTLGAHGQSPN